MRVGLISILIVAITISLAFSGSSAFGQIQNSIVVTTDKSSYSEGEIILVTGEVRDLYSQTPVSMMVIDPHGNMSLVMQIGINPDKTFNAEIIADNSNYIVDDGIHTITVQYATESRSASTTFEFDGLSTTDTSSCADCTMEDSKAQETEFLCGPGTHYDPPTNLCLLDTVDIPTSDPIQNDNHLEIENEKLQKEINELEIENSQLKNQINILNAEIQSLKDQIVSMTKEFVSSLEKLNKWFINELGS